MDAKIQELLKEIEESQKKILERSKVVFKDVSQEIFEEYPSLESFSWVQYTPYFNDGDECVFGVHADSDYGIEINETSVDDYEGDGPDWETDEELGGYFLKSSGEKLGNDYNSIKGLDWNDWEHRYVYSSKKWPDLTGIHNIISTFIGTFDEQTLKIMFGDHAKVVVYRDRVEVDEYDHE